MDHIFKDVLASAHKLPPEAQRAIAEEMIVRMRQLKFIGDAGPSDVIGGDPSRTLGREPNADEIFAHLSARYGR